MLLILLGGFLMYKNRKYDNDTKLQAINLKKKGFTTKQIMNILNIKNRTQVDTWWKKYCDGGEKLLLQDNRGKGGDKRGRPRTKFNSQEEEIEYLKAEVEWLKKSIIKKWGEMP